MNITNKQKLARLKTKIEAMEGLKVFEDSQDKEYTKISINILKDRHKELEQEAENETNNQTN